MATCPVLVLGVVMGGMGAAAVSGRAATPPPPLHPTAIMGTYEEHPCLVVGAAGDDALVESQGREVRIPRSSGFEPKRATAFLPGSIEVRGQSSTSTQLRNRIYNTRSPVGEYDGGVIFEGSDYEATLVASQAYRGCYLVLLFVDQAFLEGRTAHPSATLVFHDIGDVPAGVPTRVKASFDYVDQTRHTMRCVPLYFSRGAEIFTDQSEDAAKFFRRMELARHKAMVEAYLAKNARTRMPARPYLRFQPVFPPGVDRSAIPARLKVDFTVASDGTVEDVALERTLPADVSAAVERSVGGWLFLPKLADGVPVAISLSMEIAFGD